MPLKEGDNALLVNWCELTVSRPDGKVVYKNAFATNHSITDNILSLLFYTLLERLDQKYELLRSHLPTRKTFFNDLRALIRYLYFESWDHLLTFMFEGLELEIPPNTS